MASEPLVDFDQIDLSRVRFGKEELRAGLKQRGKFEMLDGILHLDLESDLIVGFKEIRSDDWWTSDHIPGRPIFPGALMIEGAAQLVTFDFLQRRPEMLGQFMGFGGVNDTRFRAPVEPDCRFLLAGRIHRIRSRMFHYRAQGFVERTLVFETEVIGVIV